MGSGKGDAPAGEQIVVLYSVFLEKANPKEEGTVQVVSKAPALTALNFTEISAAVLVSLDVNA